MVKYMCNCEQLYACYGRSSYERAWMLETKSSNKQNCDHCGYTVFKEYTKDSKRNRGTKKADYHPDRKLKKIKVLISDWHKNDK